MDQTIYDGNDFDGNLEFQKKDNDNRDLKLIKSIKKDTNFLGSIFTFRFN